LIEYPQRRSKPDPIKPLKGQSRAYRTAKLAGRPVKYLRSPQISKEELGEITSSQKKSDFARSILSN
jgi:hypothetical protein